MHTKPHIFPLRKWPLGYKGTFAGKKTISKTDIWASLWALLKSRVRWKCGIEDVPSCLHIRRSKVLDLRLDQCEEFWRQRRN